MTDSTLDTENVQVALFVANLQVVNEPLSSEIQPGEEYAREDGTYVTFDRRNEAGWVWQNLIYNDRGECGIKSLRLLGVGQTLDEQIESAPPRQAEWTAHNGLAMPVSADELVDVKLRNKRTISLIQAARLDWRRRRLSSDIVYWRRSSVD